MEGPTPRVADADFGVQLVGRDLGSVQIRGNV